MPAQFSLWFGSESHLRNSTEKMSKPSEKRRSRRKWMVLAAAASVAIAKFDGPANADVVESWIAAAGGSWTTTADWSPSTNYPNNGTPAGTNYQAIVSLPGSSAYMVSVNSNIAVDSLAIGSTNATVNDTAGTLAVGGLAITSGVFQLAGGTLSGGTTGATVTLSSPSEFNLVNGTLNDLTFAGSNLNFSQSGSLTITNSLNLSGNALNLTSPSETLIFAGSSQTVDDLSIDGTASNQSVLQIGATGVYLSSTLTLGPNAIVHGAVAFSNGSYSFYPDTLINKGVINADTNSQTLSIATSNFTNDATAEATNGGALLISASSWTNATGATISANASTLTFGGSWTNSGTITAVNGSTVNLGGSFTWAGLGSFSASADSTVNITGTLNNTGNTLTLNNTSPIWNLNGGTISGGSVAFGNNLNIINGTLSGVTVPTGDTIGLTAGGTLTLSGSWSNQGSISTAANSILNLGGTFTPAAIGTLNLGPGATVNITGNLSNTGNTLTLGNIAIPWNLNGGTITGGIVATGTNLQVIGGTFSGATIAAGTTVGLLANGSLTLAGSWSNLGVISAAANSTLNLGGTFTPAAIGTLNVDPSAIVNITGSLNNTGSTLTLGNISTPWNLNGGTITGGTVSTGTNLLVIGGTLSGTNIASATTIGLLGGGSLSLTGAWSNQGVISTSANSTLNLGGNYSTGDLTGISASSASTVVLGGSLNNSSASLNLSAVNGTWEFNNALVTGGSIIGSYPTVKLSGSDQFAGITIGSGSSLTVPTSSTLVLSENWINQGSISVAGRLYLAGSYGASAIGSIAENGGTVYLNGLMTMASGDQLNLSATTGSWHLDGTIAGGTVQVSGGASLVVDSGTLDGVTYSGGDLTFAGSSLYLKDNWTVADGNLDIPANGNFLYFDGGSQSVNALTINASTSTFYSLDPTLYVGGPSSSASSTLTIGAGSKFHGSMYIKNNPAISGDSLVNNGVMAADAANAQLSVQTSTFVNNGSIQATTGGSLIVSPQSWTNSQGATISSSSGSTVSLSGSGLNSGTINTGSGLVDLLGSWSNTGTINVGNSGFLYLNGTFNTAGLGTITNSGGTIILNGSLNNSGSTLNVTGGPWLLSAGTVTGGTIAVGATQPFHVYNGTFNGVTINGAALNLDENQGKLIIQNGVTTTNGGSLNITAGAVVDIDGNSQTLDNFTLNGAYINPSMPPVLEFGGPTTTGPMTVTLGPNALVHGNLNIEENSLIRALLTLMYRRNHNVRSIPRGRRG